MGSGEQREQLSPGTTLRDGAYVVGPLLGSGGFSLTYSGKESRLGTPVAIKEFFPSGCFRGRGRLMPGGEWTEEDLKESIGEFLDEGKTMERFERPGIVKVYSAFEENGTAYIVMEFLRGESFSTLIGQRGVVPEDLALKFISELGRTLDGIHLAGLLHGDIKPENIMLTDDERVILLDFGAARSYLSFGKKQNTVSLTPGYAPPEQYKVGTPIDPSTDVYALAATLYHLLTGQPPPAAPDRLAGAPIPALRSLNPNVSKKTSEGIRRGLALSQEKRPSSIRHFLGVVLDPAKADLILARETAPAKTGQQISQLVGTEAWILSLVFTPDGEKLASGDQEGKVWLWSVDTEKPLGVLDLGSPVTSLDISPDGKVLACGTQAGDIQLFDLDTGRRLATLKKGPPPIGGAKFTTDGKALVAGQTDGRVVLYEPPAKQVMELEGHGSPVNAVACSPGGRLMASVSNDRTARLWDLKTGRAVRVLAGHNRVVQAVAFSADGKLLATGSSDFTILLWDVRQGTELRKLKGHKAMVWEVLFVAEHDSLLSSAGDKTIRVWRLDSARETERLEGHESWVRALAYHPGKDLIASGGGDNTIRLWRVSWK